MSDAGKRVIAFCLNNGDLLTQCVDELVPECFEGAEFHIFAALKQYFLKYKKCITERLLDKILDTQGIEVSDQVDIIEVFREIQTIEADENEFDYYLDELKKEHTKRLWLSTLNGSVEDNGKTTEGLLELATRDPKEAYDLFKSTIGVHMEDLENKGNAQCSTLDETADKFWDDLIEREKHPEKSFGVRTGFDFIDEQTLGIHAGELLIIGGRPGCLTGDTEVYDPITGMYNRIDQMVAQKSGSVLSLNEKKLQFEAYTPSDYIYQGKKQVYTITTWSGYKIRATANHPFLTWDGWKVLEQLQVDDHIAVARKVPEPICPISLDRNLIKILAHIIAEGGCTTPSITYTNSESEIVEDCRSALLHYGAKLQHTNYRCCYRINKSTIVKQILKRYNLLGKHSYEKIIPDDIFRLCNDDLALFLGILWSTDGCVQRTRHALSFGTASPQLTQGVRKLLQRFDILSHYRTRTNGKRGSYEITISGRSDVIKFQKHIGPYLLGAKKQRLESYRYTTKQNENVDTFSPSTWNMIRQEKDKQEKSWDSILEHKCRGLPLTMARLGVSRTRLKCLNQHLHSAKIQTLIESVVYWDRIKNIQQDIIENVYDLTIPNRIGEPNFVANNFIVHNSGKSIFLLNVAANAYRAGKNVLIVSIEMPREQYQMRLYSCYCSIPFHAIRTATLNSSQKKALKTALDYIKEERTKNNHYLYIADVTNVTAFTIEAQIKKIVTKCGFKPDILIVDYLGIMRSIDKKQADWQEQLAVAEELRRIGRIQKIPIVTAVQLNRDKQHGKGTERIGRSDGIGQTCDVFLQIMEKEDENGDEEKRLLNALDDTLNIFIGKCRNGEANRPFQVYRDYSCMLMKNKDMYVPRAEQVTNSFKDVEHEEKLVQQPTLPVVPNVEGQASAQEDDFMQND